MSITTYTMSPEAQLAKDFVERTGRHIFLTGKAGTGKTTFLQQLREFSIKRMVVTAPTGVAALNAGGVTLHSFFQLPFGPFIPGEEGDERSRQQRFRFSKEKKQIIRSLELLVIDEISMVRADLLDSVDDVLRRLRRSEEPFGGVQLLMIGDLFQLSPVAKQGEWNLLQSRYDSVYFFSSQALRKTQMVSIELKHVYRQSDNEFIELLNQVRTNSLKDESSALLNTRYIEGFTPDREPGYVTLTTHNRKADGINQGQLKSVSSEEVNFKAEVTGDFPETLYPAPANLVLKEGAQVIFLRNDSAGDARFYNGKLGIVQRVSKEGVYITDIEGEEEILVEPVKWENMTYSLDPETKEIKEKEIGSFKQYPLKLAWAITIHKSQGLTFDKLVIDAEAAFAFGQVYVALSRCRSLEGIVLSSEISERSLGVDPVVAAFSEKLKEIPASAADLSEGKLRYQQKLLLDCYDFSEMTGRFYYLKKLLTQNSGVIQVSGMSDINDKAEIFDNLKTVSKKFQYQLRSLFEPVTLPEDCLKIGERVKKGAEWFIEQMELIFSDIEESLQVESDNREVLKRIDNALEGIRQVIAVKKAGIMSTQQGFSVFDLLKAVSEAQTLEFSKSRAAKPAPTFAESQIEHHELFRLLKEWRTETAKKEGVSNYRVMHQKVMVQIAVCLPESEKELKKLKGIGERSFEKYGEGILKIVSAYRKELGIEEVVLPEPQEDLFQKTPKKEKVGRVDTRERTLSLFKEGGTVAEIATQRGLVIGTIESHLAYFIEKGELTLDKLVAVAVQEAIREAIKLTESENIKDLKAKLGTAYSYGQIKMVLAFQKYQISVLD